MFNATVLVIVFLVGFINVNAMSIKRSEKTENNLEKVDQTEYPIKVNYDVYPVRNLRFFTLRLEINFFRDFIDDFPRNSACSEAKEDIFNLTACEVPESCLQDEKSCENDINQKI